KPPMHDRDASPRKTTLQGKKSHEQQIRTLERKPDVPDARQVEDEAARAQRNGGTRTLRNDAARQSEFSVSRGGLNQESQHNKHNDQGQSGHKPQKQQG